MAGKHSKGRKKLTSGWATINDNEVRPAEDTSINESADLLDPGSTMALDFQDVDGSGLEIPGTKTAESHAANDRAAESQKADGQTAGYHGPTVSENASSTNVCTPAVTPVIDEDGSGQDDNQDQGPRRGSRTSHGFRRASRAPQAPSRANAASNQSERAASRAPARSRQREVIQATEWSVPLGQNSRGHSVSLRRARRASSIGVLIGRSNNPRNGTQAQSEDTDFEELLPYEPQDVYYYPQNGNSVSQYYRSGGPMPLQHGQNAQHHHYHASSGGTNDFVPGVNQGQVPPLQYGNSYSGPIGHDMPNVTPQRHQNPYLQPPNYQSFNGSWQAPGLPYANRPARLIEFDPRSNTHRSQLPVERPQRANSAELGSSYDDTVCIWPSHLSDEERHRRGIFTREELRDRGMPPPAQPTRRRDRRTGPAANLGLEENSTAPTGGLNPEATNAASTNSPAIIDLTSVFDPQPEATTASVVAASDSMNTGLVLTNKGNRGTKRAGSPLATNPRAAPKKPRLSHGEVYQRPDGTIMFRAFGSSVSEPTVRHEPNREAMIADASTRGQYVHAPAMGGGGLPHDRTSYLEAQREWYCSDRPHDWHSSLGLLYQFQRGNRPLRSDPVGPLRWRGNVVLNNRNEIMTDWPDLPMTLSSALEGFRLEMYSRLDQRITINDILDRMPSNPDGSRAVVPSAISNRRCRFRERNGLVSWDHRDGTAGFYDMVKARLTPEQLASNSTKGFLGLSETRLKEIKDGNRLRAGGRYLKRAGKNVLTQQEREARAERERARLNAVDSLAEIEPSILSGPGSEQDLSMPPTPGYGHRSDDEEDIEVEDEATDGNEDMDDDEYDDGGEDDDEDGDEEATEDEDEEI